MYWRKWNATPLIKEYVIDKLCNILRNQKQVYTANDGGALDALLSAPFIAQFIS